MNYSKKTSHDHEELFSPDSAGASNPSAGVSNALMQDRLLSQLQGVAKNPQKSVDQTSVIADGLAMTSNVDKFAKH